MMMTVQQTAPFSGLLLFTVSRYSFPAVAKSAAGRENPSYSVATPDAPCVFFLCLCLCAPVVYASVLKPLLYLRNGGSGGAAFGLAGTH
ncbi:ash family protein [Escherichia coli]|nr:ash family protein [Escherichia coli]EFN8599733.1 ash family protein [Escherichia coli O79:H40]EFC6944654.1 ash family protein [Escherichia coli]EFD0677144.1 ash family protein [Escherichia coli]EFI9544170.1 ash family protein [Escherichia coli]